MKVIAGLLCVLAGLVLGVYVGLWLCFIGGIVDIINAVKATEIVATAIAFGIVKVVFAGLFGWLAGVVPMLFGVALIQSD
jgi:hypothetical protein